MIYASQKIFAVKELLEKELSESEFSEGSFCSVNVEDAYNLLCEAEEDLLNPSVDSSISTQFEYYMIQDMRKIWRKLNKILAFLDDEDMVKSDVPFINLEEILHNDFPNWAKPLTEEQ